MGDARDVAEAGYGLITSQEKVMDWQKRQGIEEVTGVIAVVLLAFLSFVPVLGFSLLWDDFKIATDQAQYRIGGAEDLGEQLGKALPFSPNYWRPLPIATFLWQINAGLGGSLWLHLASLALHCLNAYALYKLLGLIKTPPTWTVRQAAILRFGAAALFAVHPVMVEPVAWVSARFDLMMTTFSLLLLYVLFGMRSDRIQQLLVYVLTLAALLCKEQAVMLLPAYPFLAVLFGQGEIRRTGWRRVDLTLDRRAYSLMGLAFMTYLALRWNALGYLLLPESVGFKLDPVQHLLVFGATAFHAWGLMLAPFGWAGGMHFIEAPIDVRDMSLWIQLAIVLVAIAASLVAVFHRSVVGLWAAALAVMWLILMPILNIVPLVALSANMLVGDRFLVLPIALLGVIAYRLICEYGGGLRTVRFVAALSLVGLFLTGSVVNVRYLLPTWTDQYQLWQSWLDRAPRAAWLRASVARELLLKEDFAGAEALAKEAIAQLKGQPEATMTRRWELGRALSMASIAVFEQGRPTEGIALMEEAAMTDIPFSVLYRSLLARFYLQIDDVPAAQRQMVQAVRLASYQGISRLPSVGYINLGVIALGGGHWEPAGLLFKEGYDNLSGGAWSEGLPDEAEAWKRLSEDLSKARLPKAAEAAESISGQLVMTSQVDVSR